jgi:hypothetical protein
MGQPLNFLIAGMYASTEYTIFHQVTSSTGDVTNGPEGGFTTGALPSNFIPAQVVRPPDQLTDTTQSIVLLNIFLQNLPNYASPTGMDMAGNILWYYMNPTAPTWPVFLTRMLPGGNMLLLLGTNFNGLREIDLAWNVIRETNVTRINNQLTAMGLQTILNFNHEAIRLPNGHTLTLANNQRLLTDVQGPGTVDVLGDVVLDLDENLNVKWAWNAFDHLNPKRKAILGEICTTVRPAPAGQEVCPGPPSMMLAPTANDWLHANAIFYDASDSNIVVSLRHQDWVIKIDYANGTGTGNILWRLGNGGDFTMINTPKLSWPWFSHQHDVDLVPSLGPGYISMFDNGNTRHSADPNADSRAQVLKIDEVNKTADIYLSASLTRYSDFAGSVQRLPNGNFYALGGGITNPSGGYYNWCAELVPTGLPSAGATLNYILTSPRTAYRSFRIVDLYTAP